MLQEEIKKKIEEQYENIRLANEWLEELREMCKHPNTEEANYSWRPGNVNRVELCSDCGHVVKYLDM